MGTALPLDEIETRRGEESKRRRCLRRTIGTWTSPEICSRFKRNVSQPQASQAEHIVVLAETRKPEQSPLTMCGYVSMGGNPNNRLAPCPDTRLCGSLRKKHIGRYVISKGRARRDEEREGSRQGYKHPPCSRSAHKKKSLHPARGRKTKAKLGD